MTAITAAERAAVAGYLDCSLAGREQRVLSTREVAAGSGVALRRALVVLMDLEREPNGLMVERWSKRKCLYLRVRRAPDCHVPPEPQAEGDPGGSPPPYPLDSAGPPRVSADGGL